MTHTDGTHRQTKVGCTACGNYEAHAPLCLNRSKPMTREDAQAEAVKRWGSKGAVTVWPLETPTHSHSVGTATPFRTHLPAPLDGGRAFHEKGCGPSWEAAFADADRRAE